MSIPGVTFQFGNIQIVAPKLSGNEAEVRINAATGHVLVGLNGQAAEFPAAQVANVTYQGGAGGGDTFINTLSVPGVCYGMGGNNDFTGGGSYNMIYLYGNNNVYSAAGLYNTVFQNGGQGNRISNPTGAPLQVYP